MYRYESLLSETNTTKGRLLSETNRDMDQQRRLVASEKTRQETLEFFQQQNKENQELIAKLETQVRSRGAGGIPHQATFISYSMEVRPTVCDSNSRGLVAW